jgi:VWFA-related protein
MIRGRKLVSFAWCLAAAAAAVLAQDQRPPVFRGGAVLVTVDAYPQQNGRTVEGLTPEDFEVLEDGKPQKIENFDFVRVDGPMTEQERHDPSSVAESFAAAAEPRNRVFVVYLDQYHVGLDGAVYVHRPLADTLTQLLAPGDLFAVMTPKMRARDLTFARRLEALEDQLSRYAQWGQKNSIVKTPQEQFIEDCLQTSGMGPPSSVADGAVMRNSADLLRLRWREDATLTNIEELIGYLGTLREARTVVLLFTDGWQLFGPDPSLMPQRTPDRAGQQVIPACNAEFMRLANLEDERRFRELITEANRRNVTFYPVTPGGLAVFDTSMKDRVTMNPNGPINQTVLSQDANRLRNRTQSLIALAENTDGIAVVNTNDLASGVRKIVSDVSAYYVLGYYATNQKLDGAYHRIQVRIKRPGVTIKARRGYFAPNAAELNAKTSSAAPIAAPVGEALSGMKVPRPDAELIITGVVRGGDLNVVAEIPGSRAESGKWAQGADARVVVTAADGAALPAVTARVEPGARSALLVVPLPATAASPWRVDVTFASGADRLQDRDTVDAPKTTTLLGNPIAYRAAPGPRSPIRPVADMQFRRTERVHVEWPALKPLDARQARVLGRNGQPLTLNATTTEREVNGATMVAVDINLAPLSAGDYLIELTAGSQGAAETRLMAFRVVQ